MPANPSKTQKPLYIPYAGNALLELPLLNKDSAFSTEEREHFNLHGLIPNNIENIEEQTQRSYQQYLSFDNNLIDASIKRDLLDIKKQFLSNEFEAKLK